MLTWKRIVVAVLAGAAFVGAAFVPGAEAGLQTLAGALLGLLAPQVM